MPALRSIRTLVAVAVVATALLPVYFVADGLTAEIIWNSVVFAQLSLAVAALVGFRTNRLAWSLVIAGQACFLAGDIGFTVLEFGLERDLFPSFADWLYLAGYPLVAIGLATILWTRNARRDAGGMIDAGIVTIAATAILWVFIMDPTVSDSELSVLARAVAVAYTAGDVLALGMLALLITSHTTHSWALTLTTASVSTLLAGDVVFALLELQESGYALGNPVDALWWISYTLITLAVLHPETEHLGDRRTDSPTGLTAVRSTALAVAALAAPMVLIARINVTSASQAIVLLISTVVLFLLVIARLQLVAEDLDESRLRLEHEATHDALTGLANRSVLIEQLSTAGHQDPPSDIAVLALDLDDFKDVNDRWGHPAGDLLLQRVADRLRTTVRPDDLVARLGGDEFAVVLPGADRMAAAAVAQRIVETIARPIELDGAVVRQAVSVGIATGNATSTHEQLMREADQAMYEVKRTRTPGWAFFDAGARTDPATTDALATHLSRAVERDQLLLHYQPVVSLPDRTVIGVEALLRWRHPELGLVPPNHFVPIAEETGSIVPIGRWVLRAACSAVSAWSDRPIHLSVNVSPCQLGHPGFVDDVVTALRESGWPAERLLLELTETSAVGDTDAAAEVLGRLRAVGVCIALDDLGSGFATLEYLRTLPVDVVKFDRSLVQDLGNNARLLHGLIGLAESLGVRAVVEGVETEEQAAAIVDAGAAYAQGYLFARPAPIGDIAALVESSRYASAT